MIVVTGGAGFIGSVLVKRLNQIDIDDILIVDHLGTSSKWKNLLNLNYYEYLPKEIFLEWLETEEPDIEVIFHLGACSSTTEEDTDYLYSNNFLYTRELAQYCLDRDIRFIYASSAATYGKGELGYSDADNLTMKLHPLNKYGFSKLLMDKWVIQNEVTDQLCGLRFFNVFGPNEYHKGNMRSMVYKAYNQIIQTGSVKLFRSNSQKYADGDQKRDFIYVQDVVDVMLWFWDNPDTGGIFNLGRGIAASWNELMEAVFNAMHKEINIQYIDMPENLYNSYQNYTCADLTKLRNAGYDKPFTSLKAGVSDYVNNFLQKDFPRF